MAHFDGNEIDFSFDELYEVAPDDNFFQFDDNDDEEATAQWRFIEDFVPTIEVEPIDQVLLQKARMEVPQVLRNITRQIPAASLPNAILTPNDFFNVWFRKSLYDHMMDWLIKYKVKGISIADLEGFIKVELYLAIYNCTPEVFYSVEYGEIYMVHQCIAKKNIQRY
jgi:hypothetical protein